MTITFDLRDRYGEPIEQGQRIALRVHRCSAAMGSWYHRTNEHHWDEWWIPGHFEFYRSHSNAELVFKPDREAVKALEKPMGKEREDQNVDYLNYNLEDPSQFDTINVPAPGTFRSAE